jgi:UDP:flavonoid glycosyltransferase YjiC (YdhE family)
MKVALICNDTRGGIQPYVALGLGLRAAGHEAVVVAPENYAGFVSSRGLEFRGMRGDVQAVIRNPEYAEQLERGFLASHRLMVRLLTESIRDWTHDALEACRGANLIVGGFGGMMTGQGIAEALGVPFVQAHVQPVTPTGAYSGLLMPDRLRGRSRWLDRLSHRWSRQVFWQPLRGPVNAARKEVLGLGPAPFWGNIGMPRRDGDLVLHGYSPHLLPRPSDWPSGVQITGYWFLDHEEVWTPPADLVEFLDAGEPPIAVGFGSMSLRDAEATTRLVVDAVERVGQRVVLLSGWGGVGGPTLPDWAFAVESVPHDWLFPRTALSVHHGGAGTTGASLRAGVPSVIVPFGADQPFWGWLLADRGLAAPPIPRKRLTADRLASAISSVLKDDAMRERAAKLGRRIRDEDGVARAVERLEGLDGSPRRQRGASPSVPL